MPSKPSLTIVIPAASGEQRLPALLENLQGRPGDWEVIIVLPHDAPDFSEVDELTHAHNCKLITSPPGRGAQMNSGAEKATSHYLCFLHADSKLNATAMKRLSLAASLFPDAIAYFDLRFAADGPYLTALNTLGVFIRSRIFKLPFGDQGLCMSAETFQKLARFDTDQRPGEDLRLVIRAHRERIPVESIRAYLTTSARKYAQRGWLRTTATHLRTTVTEILRKGRM